MTNKSLANPYDRDVSLIHSRACDFGTCKPAEDQSDQSPTLSARASAETQSDLGSVEDFLYRAVESAMVRGIFGHNDFKRRQFIGADGLPQSSNPLSETPKTLSSVNTRSQKETLYEKA